jgi:adenylate cyclase
MAKTRVQRRLAAILAADVVGYSRLMRADEAETLAQLKALRKELIDPKITEYGGRIVKTTGDGILIEFPSAVDAVQHAIDVQTSMQPRNADLPHERRMEIRIGINVGDVIVEGDDLFGDGVNVAARLEGIAEPGGICISGNAYEQVRDKLQTGFEDLGEQHVKNIDRPVQAYRVSLESDRPTKATDIQSGAAALSPSDKLSIAVLPFDNMSGDPDQEYFSDGMAEDLITDLSKISSLSVAARNSSFSFKGQMPDISEVAEKIGVAFVLEGSVRKMGDRLRINAQLIDGADGRHIWAERYDGNMAEIFEFQDAIREQIVLALEVSLTPADTTLTERNPTDSVEAYDLFLKGRAYLHRHTPELLQEAIKLLEAAIEIDPNFAEAYGNLSLCYFFGWVQMWPGFDENLAKANELAEKGVALDGTSAVALMRFGWIQNWLGRHEQAVANLEKALDLAPNNAEICASFGQILNYWGNPERGQQMLERAFRLEMFVPPSWEFQLGRAHLLQRHYDEAVNGFKRAIEGAPNFVAAHVDLAWAYAELIRRIGPNR